MGFFAYMWVGLLILFLVLEGSTVALVSLWFAVGSLAAIVAALLEASLGVQVGIFLGFSSAVQRNVIFSVRFTSMSQR